MRDEVNTNLTIESFKKKKKKKTIIVYFKKYPKNIRQFCQNNILTRIDGTKWNKIRTIIITR